MPYVVAHNHYYPCGGFNDIKFQGSYEDCNEVAEALRERYDRVDVVDPYVNTNKDHAISNYY